MIVEDDPNIASLVAKYLKNAGHEPVIAGDGKTGLQLFRRLAPKFVILDLNLPSMDGQEVCREIRKTSEVPVLMLTAREEETDRIVGFSLGADDYVVKPFSPRELVERVKAILRRTRLQAPEKAVLRYGDLTVDADKHKVLCGSETVPLTPSEFTLLYCLMSSPGRVFSRDELMGQLYRGGEVVVDRVIVVHIGKLRQKIEPDPTAPRYVLTVHGLGYRFVEAESGADR